MMSRARLDRIVRVAGICFLALLPSAAAAQGWAPTVATTNAAVNLTLPAPVATPMPPPVPPMPRTKPAQGMGVQGMAGQAKTAQARAIGAKAAQTTPSRAKTAPLAANNGNIVVPPLDAASPSEALVAEGSAITTGSIDSIEQTRALSPQDSSRILFAEADAAADITTGTADVQGSDLARGYCVSVADAAADARIAHQRAKLAELEKQINARIAALETKTAEYQSWVERRDEFLERVTGKLVEIYSQMEPEAAALQLVSMDEETAAALLTKLDPQNSSSILNEMRPDKAARLTATIAGAAHTQRKKRTAAPVAETPQGAPAGERNPREGRS
jgi:flagellar motility protein MotE (MotC chaperone)